MFAIICSSTERKDNYELPRIKYWLKWGWNCLLYSHLLQIETPSYRFHVWRLKLQSLSTAVCNLDNVTNFLLLFHSISLNHEVCVVRTLPSGTLKSPYLQWLINTEQHQRHRAMPSKLDCCFSRSDYSNMSGLSELASRSPQATNVPSVLVTC